MPPCGANRLLITLTVYSNDNSMTCCTYFYGKPSSHIEHQGLIKFSRIVWRKLVA